MFDKIKQLVEGLPSTIDLTKYKETVSVRKALQEIKKEAQKLRLETKFKK